MKFNLVSQTRKPIQINNLILMFKSLGYYFCMFLFPTHLGIHHTYMERWGLTKEETKQTLKLDGFFYLGIVMCLAMLYLFFFRWGNPITYGLTWMFIFLLPWTSIISIHQSIAERYSILALIGFIFAFVNVLAFTPYALVIGSLFCGYWICRNQMYMRRFRDILSAARQNTENFEDSAAAWRWRGGQERNLGLTQESFQSWMMAWRLRPYDFVLNNNIAMILAGQGRYADAQKFLDMAKKCPLPTEELATKWKARQDRIQGVIDTDRAKLEARQKVGRNSPCPCGSGKKYKHCCIGR